MSEAFGEQLLQRLPCPVVQCLCRSLRHSHFLSYFAQRVALNGYEVEDCPLAFACVVEDAGFGSQYARPVAETAMQSAAQALRGY